MATEDTKTLPTEAYEVVRAAQNLDHLEMDGKRYDFKRGDGMMFRMRDRGEAMALKQQYPAQVTVQKVRYPDAHDRGHRYFFTSPGMPWHQYDELGKKVINATVEGQEECQEEYPRVPQGSAVQENQAQVRQS